MKNVFSKLIFTAFLCFIATFSICSVKAVNPGSGYVVDSSGAVTNIKWEMTADATLSFEIDASATDKLSSTVIPNRDPVTGERGDWNKALPTYSGAKKIIIGDGITEVSGFMCLDTLLGVEVPTSLTIAGEQAFQGAYRCTSLYVRGTQPEKGTFDFTYFTVFKKMSFDSCCSISKIIFNENLTGNLPHEFIKECVKMKELTIPAGVAQLDNGSISKSDVLEIITILGKNTLIESKDVFAKNAKYPAIKASADSKAAEFAKANGFTFIDIESGDVTKGTLPTGYSASPGDTSNDGDVSSGGASSSGGTEAKPTFYPSEVTAWGHLTDIYQNTPIVDTFWTYREDTKTLEFISNVTPGSYNETGNLQCCDKEQGDWAIYREKIEHIIVGSNIAKLSEGVCANFPILKDVRISKDVVQMNDGVFNDSPLLTTVWVDGSERIEGRVDLSYFKRITSSFSGTSIKEIALPGALLEAFLEMPLPITFKTAITNAVSEKAIELAKTNVLNIYNSSTGESYNYYVEIPEGLPMCGPRAVFDFDEATGTLRIIGAGVISDINNYFGGGSKTQPWFSIKKQVKHIIIDNRITTIGRYAFCEFTNLETVAIPNEDNLVIMNAAFQKCNNLNTVYKNGNDPIEGTLDLSNVDELKSYIFAEAFMYANVIINENVVKIGDSVFEGNVGVNFVNIYGTNGSYAETYALENGLNFLDVDSNAPSPITCVYPESETEAANTEAESIAKTDTEAPETQVNEPVETRFPHYNLIEYDQVRFERSPVVIIAAVAVVVIFAIVAVVIIFKKKVK